MVNTQIIKPQQGWEMYATIPIYEGKFLQGMTSTSSTRLRTHETADFKHEAKRTTCKACKRLQDKQNCTLTLDKGHSERIPVSKQHSVKLYKDRGHKRSPTTAKDVVSLTHR